MVNCFWEFYKKPKYGEIYNIGGGRFSNCSIIEALELIEKITKIKIKKNIVKKNRVGDHIWYISNIHKFKKDFHKKIIQATFIENRRWNLLLEGNLLLKLSETDKKQSIENYFKLTNNLSYNNLINVRMIDLRDTQKAVIAYK